jgi:hypothetical protein
MLKKRRRNAAARVISPVMAGSVLLLGCSAPKPAAVSGAPKPGFTVDTPLDVIAADARGKAVLVQDVPGVMSNPRYPLFEDMSLAQIAIIASGKLPKTKLDEVQTDLDKLAAKEAAGQ